MSARLAVHFGIVPIDPDPQARPVSIDGHEGTRTEILLFSETVEAYVSGSWACWGPADQDTDGDQTLHVVAYCKGGEARAVRERLVAKLGENSRLLDYVVVTDPEDHSHVYTEALPMFPEYS